MIDFDEIRKQAEAAQNRALAGLKEMTEKAEKAAEHLTKEAEAPASPETNQPTDAAQKQVEIMGQLFDSDAMAQIAANQQTLQQMVNQKVAEASAAGVETLMNRMFGEDMGVLAAAMETLAMEDEDSFEEEPDFDLETEQELCGLLDDTMARIEAMPEPEPVAYGKDMDRWGRFGILLSGMVSVLNDHRLDEMDVEEHIPVMEQQVVSIVRRSWGIDGRGDLLDMIRYLMQEGYILRYRIYTEAESPEELFDEDMDEEDRESIARAWRFVQRYRGVYAPEFLTGWDVGRAAMLARWGSYIGWITESEAVGILWELSQKAAE